jgi:hypothetical protein
LARVAKNKENNARFPVWTLYVLPRHLVASEVDGRDLDVRQADDENAAAVEPVTGQARRAGTDRLVAPR